jgi:hypothetical protein
MKFVTVMDMWLLLCNIGLLGCLLYVVRQLVRVVKEFQAFKNMEIIDKELKSIIAYVENERDNAVTVSENELKVDFYDDLIYTLEKRRNKNIILGTTPK